MTGTHARLLGRQLGNYTLTKVIGAGGFAEVYLGIHRHLETQAAIKVLQAQLNQADQESFLAEARIVARLRHPHIVHILEFGIEDDVPYLVMNYAEHGTLRGYFQRGVPLAPDVFLPYLKQIASALQYAHDQGLIHRDVKPENMLLDVQDEVFLSDFGIATQARNSRSQSVEEIIGTVVYMSPEQLQGKPRPASDQYSLAVVVYEWLTGTRPFQGANYLAIASQHVTTPPRPLREHVAHLSPVVEQVVLTALTKDYHQRYARVLDFAEALEQAWLSGRYLSPQEFAAQPAVSQPSPALAAPSPTTFPQITTPPAGTPLGGVIPTTVLAPTQATPFMHTTESPASAQGSVYSRRTLIGGGIAAAVLAGGGLSWAITHFTGNQGSNTGSQTRTNDAPPLKSRFMPQAKLLHTYKHTTKLSNVTWSKDSHYVATVEDDTVVHIWNAVTGEDLWSINALGMPKVLQVAWSPDGRSLAILDSESPAETDHPIQMVEIFDTTSHQQRSSYSFSGQHIAWSPDSRYLAVSGLGGDVMPLGSLISIWNGQMNHDPTYTYGVYETVGSMAWKPDSKELAIGLVSRAASEVTIWKLSEQNVHSQEDMNAPRYNPKNAVGGVDTISWSAGSENRIASAGSSNVSIWDADTLGKSYDQSYVQYAQPAVWSPGGLYLASATTADKTIRVWNGRDQSIASVCAEQAGTVTAIAWSPDGRYLASTVGEPYKDQTICIWQVEN